MLQFSSGAGGSGTRDERRTRSIFALVQGARGTEADVRAAFKTLCPKRMQFAMCYC